MVARKSLSPFFPGKTVERFEFRNFTAKVFFTDGAVARFIGLSAQSTDMLVVEVSSNGEDWVEIEPPVME